MTTRTYRAQKSGLARAKKEGPHAVVAECRRAVAEWEETGPHSKSPTPGYAGVWPDDWCRWNIALSDAVSELGHAPRSLDDILKELPTRPPGPLGPLF